LIDTILGIGRINFHWPRLGYNDKPNDVKRSIEGRIRTIQKAKNSLTSMAGTIHIRAWLTYPTSAHFQLVNIVLW